MVQAMLLGGLRRCEVLGLRLCDVQPGEKRLFIADGKGGHRTDRAGITAFLHHLGRLPGAGAAETAPTDRVFVVLKGQRRGLPLSAAGLDEIVAVRAAAGSNI